jgi:4-amino-4-deoxy-L-arabinose transferase-like glycosyltransferase
VRRLLALAVLCATTALWGLDHQLQDIDPAQYADVARRVASSGHWLDLSDAKGPFINKPPMMIWAQALAMRALPDTSAAARLPAVVFGALALVALFALGRTLYDASTAALAVALFAATPAFHLMIADPKVDMPLIAFTTASVGAFVNGAQQRRRSFVLLGWLFAALAVLSKGPVGLVLVTCALAPEWLRGALGPQSTLWRRIADALPGLGLVLVGAVCSPFYVALAANHGLKAVTFLLWDHGPGRLFDKTVVHDGTTPVFFLHTGLWALAPLSLVLVVALLKRLAFLVRTRRLPPDAGRVVVWWFALPFALISFSSLKMPQYAFWLGPPAALMAAHELRSLDLKTRWLYGWSALTALLTLALGGVLLTVCFPAADWVLPAWAFTCIVGSVAAAFALRPWGATVAAAGAAVAAMAAFFLLFHAHVHRELLAYQAGQALGVAVRTADPQGTTVPHMGTSPQYSVALYAERDLSEADEPVLKDMVQHGLTRTAVVTDAQAELLTTHGWRVETLVRAASYGTSVPNRTFLNATTRPSVLTWLSAVRVTPPP